MDFKSRDDFCAAIIDPLLNEGKTVLIPTFTYTSNGRFDPETTPTKLGVINKWMLKAPGVRRSEHPIFSYAALGPQAEALVTNIGLSAFGHDSVFDRLNDKNASFLYVGRPVWMGNTMIHHIEQICGATYRVNKAFKTEVYRGDRYIGTNYSAFVRRRDVPEHDFEFCFRRAAQRMFDQNLVRQVGNEVELTNISAHGYDEVAELLKSMFSEDPCVFIQRPFIDK
ncbi:MAG: AAC(3) family N-acetyltransferase [Rhodobacteraceae bacterium]|nr:AAC(3) family N-acetyltransferase [Paracoccaceae bacterium]